MVINMYNRCMLRKDRIKRKEIKILSLFFRAYLLLFVILKGYVMLAVKVEVGIFCLKQSVGKEVLKMLFLSFFCTK